jgi:hypothetical protein
MGVQQLKLKLTAALEAVKADERLQETATLDTNAPLALVQVQLESQMRTLRWVLKLMEDDNG